MSDTGVSFGLPPANRLQRYRIWDSYFTPSQRYSAPDQKSRLSQDIARSVPAIEKGCFEKLCYFPHVGLGTSGDAQFEDALRARPDSILEVLRRWPERLIGMIQLNANRVPQSLDAINRWLRDGPMVGVYFPGGGPASLTCTHRNFDPLIKRISEVGGAIMQHTWFKTGGKHSAGESTPAELAVLAARHPHQKFICAHTGGE